MTRSESIKELATALAKAQGELKNPHFDAQNPHFKSKFASLAAVRNAVIPVFSAHGLSISQWPISNSSAAGCVTLLAHSSGEFVEESFLIPIDKANAHGYVSAVSYAKRITMQAVANVVGDEDDDGNGATDKPAAPEPINGKGAMKPITPTTGAWDAVPLDVQNQMLDNARRVSVLLKKKDIKGAVAELAEACDAFEGRENYMQAQWTCLDSSERSALKANGFEFPLSQPQKAA